MGKNLEAKGRIDWKSKVKKIIMIVDVLFSTQNQVKSKKKRKVITSTDVLFSARNDL